HNRANALSGVRGRRRHPTEFQLMDLKNKAAVVTGSSAGVGRAAVLKFAGRGCSVVVNYNRSRTEAEETAALCRERGAGAVVVEADVSVEADCRRLVQAAVDAF